MQGHHLHRHCLRRRDERHQPRPLPPACKRSAGRGHHGQRRYFLGKELLELEEMGTAAAILGKSLYTGALDLGRCVALVQK